MRVTYETPSYGLKVVIERDGDDHTLSEVLGMLEDLLRGAGFLVDKDTLDIIEPERADIS